MTIPQQFRCSSGSRGALVMMTIPQQARCHSCRGALVMMTIPQQARCHSCRGELVIHEVLLVDMSGRYLHLICNSALHLSAMIYSTLPHRMRSYQQSIRHNQTACRVSSVPKSHGRGRQGLLRVHLKQATYVASTRSPSGRWSCNGC